MAGDGDYAPGELVGDAVDATLLRQVGEREREREATKHKQLLRMRWGRAVCQRCGGAFDVPVSTVAMVDTPSLGLC